MILSAVESEALVRWLETTAMEPSGAEEMLMVRAVIFFTAKANLSEVSEEGTTLEPLQFGYNADMLSLPIRWEPWVARTTGHPSVHPHR